MFTMNINSNFTSGEVASWLDQLGKQLELPDTEKVKLDKLRDRPGSYLFLLSKESVQQTLGDPILGDVVYNALHSLGRLLNTFIPDSVFRFHGRLDMKMSKATASTRPIFRNSQGRFVELMVIYDWPDFENGVKAFYETDKVVKELDQEASPLGLEFRQLINEHTCHLFFSYLVSKAIEPFTKNHQFIYNYTLCHLIPDFTFSLVDDQQTPLKASIPFLIKHFLLMEHNLQVAYAFNNQGADPKDQVLAINQALSCMLKAGLKYGVLTTIQSTWVFKREGDRVYVSRAVPAREFLKVIYWICKKAIEEETYADFDQPDLYKELFSPVLPADHSSENLEPTKFGRREYGQTKRKQPPRLASTYSPDQDKFKKPNIARQTMDFTPIYHTIGYGRSGTICMAKLTSGKLVAMKAVDIYNRAHLVDELVAEARILFYAQQLGLRCTPNIYYSGYEDAVYTNLIEYLSPAEYYQKTSYEEMNHHEMRLFYDALVELASNAIVHGDIRPRHIFFSKDCTRCVLIDYGFGKIVEEAVEAQLEYEFEEHILSLLSTAPSLLSLTNFEAQKMFEPL